MSHGAIIKDIIGEILHCSKVDQSTHYNCDALQQRNKASFLLRTLHKPPTHSPSRSALTELVMINTGLIRQSSHSLQVLVLASLTVIPLGHHGRLHWE